MCTEVAKRREIWCKRVMKKEIVLPGAERSELESLRTLVRQQQELIETLEEKLAKQEKRIEELEAELKASKKLKGKPKLSASRLNEKPKSVGGKGFAKRSKKGEFKVDEERIIEPPEGEEKRRGVSMDTVIMMCRNWSCVVRTSGSV